MGKSVPVINQWYQDIAVNRLFEVVAVDEYSALIDIRYADIPCDDETTRGTVTITAAWMKSVLKSGHR